MFTPQLAMFILIGAAIVAILPLLARPSIALGYRGQILAFLALFIFPLLAGGIGAAEHFENSKKTEFCLSCHIMEPWGKSLQLDDMAHIPAAHFQNHRVPTDEACYACHQDYGMWGTLRTKLEGLHHVYVNYLGTPMNPIHLYRPFDNGQCLHCHLGARSFQSDALHSAVMDDLKNNRLSCVSSGCHDSVHDVGAPAQQAAHSPAN